jgi:DNA-binding Xre family transcriptional regulator
MTYEELSKTTGISVPTLQSLATRPSYDTRLSTIAKICRALECSLTDLLELSTAKRKR